METLSKIAIYMGMAIACSIFVMFTISIMPHIINEIENHWEYTLPVKSDEEIKKLFYETTSYKSFNVKYPENGEYYHLHGNGHGTLEVAAMNFESYNVLRLTLEYDRRSDSIEEYISCENQKNDQYYFLRGTLATQFIEKVDCLSGSGLVDAPSNLIDEDGNIVPIKNSSRGVIFDQD